MITCNSCHDDGQCSQCLAHNFQFYATSHLLWVPTSHPTSIKQKCLIIQHPTLTVSVSHCSSLTVCVSHCRLICLLFSVSSSAPLVPSKSVQTLLACNRSLTLAAFDIMIRLCCHLHPTARMSPHVPWQQWFTL